MIKLFDYYYLIASEAKCKTIHGEGIKYQTQKNASKIANSTRGIFENLPNETLQIIYSLLRE